MSNLSPTPLTPEAPHISHPAVSTADAQVAGLVTELRQAARRGGIAGTIAVGEILFHRVFNGDLGALRRRGRKSLSFRALAAHPQLPMSAASLWRATATYELSRRWPDLGRADHLGVGHVSVVLGLPDDQQDALLRQAEAERWTRATLQLRATELRPNVGRRGRPPVPVTLRSLRAVESAALQAIETLQSEPELNVDQREVAETCLVSIRRACGELEAAFSTIAASLQYHPAAE